MALRPLRRAGPHRVVAGIDLGSNSFHLLVARAEEDGRVHVLDRLRDPVRLAAGLDEERQIGAEAVERAERALERFGERVREMPSSALRAVGTNTLRQARNGHEVEEVLSGALGHPVEIISGREEARLIYTGVSHAMPEISGRQLVLDIGGGSTECIIGQGFAPLVLDSLYMGCVGYTRRFFGDGRLERESFQRAKLAAGLELSSITARYLEIGWERAVGASGTVLAAREVIRANGWGDGITLEALERLEDAMVGAKRVDKLSLVGLENERAAVFAGGVAILAAAFEFLRIQEMTTSSGALREGLVHELLGRETEGDPRDRTIATLATRYKVDAAQARRVEQTATGFFESANETWGHDSEPARTLLSWAARVHEIGLSISYAGYQKHGAYILEHAEMPGFSLDEQTTLAAIVGAHRRRLSRRSFEVLAPDRRALALHLTLLLRLAVRLHHSRSDEPLPELRLAVKKSRLRLACPEGWLDDRPLTRADLEQEAGYLARADFRLELVPR